MNSIPLFAFWIKASYEREGEMQGDFFSFAVAMGAGV